VDNPTKTVWLLGKTQPFSHRTILNGSFVRIYGQVLIRFSRSYPQMLVLDLWGFWWLSTESTEPTTTTNKYRNLVGQNSGCG
jgi:hypothetical protein